MLWRSKPAPRPGATRLSRILLSIACAGLTTSCAGFGRGSVPEAETAPPPKLTIPAEARNPCQLYRLPANPTQADLEVGYVTRGAQLIECDGLRQVVVTTFDTQAEALAAQIEARERRRSRQCRWLRLGCG
jgi:hypothetical protein